MLFARGSRFLLLAFLAGSISGQTQSPITVSVDAAHAQEKILHTRLEIPVHAGALTLYYPKWIAGMHEPSGPIGNLAGLRFEANGRSIPWRRDLLDVFTFHLNIPDGVERLTVSFDYLEAAGGTGSINGIATDKLMTLNWYTVVLYPAGTPVSKLTYEVDLRLPEGWRYGTALHSLPSDAGARNGIVRFEPVSLSRLIDSPVIAGEYYNAVDITPLGEPIHHEIDIVADSSAALAVSDDFRKELTNLVAESGKLFGSRHYSEYHFLLTLSDHTAHFGVEHHESNDSRLAERALLSAGSMRDAGALLAHEFAHSWSGKFRRPAGEDVPDYQTPMKTDLLWVYEGSTSYFGDLLAARSGLWTAEQYRQALASYAASLGVGRPGRTWRPVLDTAVAVPGMFGGGWLSWRRGSDYYEEGELMWLDVATRIHELSQGKKSFDDFARLFYGGPNHGPELKAYAFEDLVNALNQIVSYEWTELLNHELDSTSAEAPLAGIEASGWKLTFTNEPIAGERVSRGIGSSTFSLGLTLAADGTVTDAVYNGAAFKAGIAPGMKVVGVNGRVYTPDVLADVIKSSKDESKTIELLVIDDDYYRTCKLEYGGGEKYPHLIRENSKPDYLTELLKPVRG